MTRPAAPEFTFIPGRIENDTSIEQVSINVRTYPVEFDYTPARVHLYLAQKPSVRMWTTEGRYDIYA